MISFGTGGWRAIIGDDFIRQNICFVAQGVANMIKQQNKTDKPVVIGYDRRFLSDRAAIWMAEVLSGNGISVLFLHRSAPTPLIMHTVKKKELHFGLEITASHNPAEYNGIKLIVDEGRDAPIETTTELENIIAELCEKDVLSVSFETAVAEGKVTYIENPFKPLLAAFRQRRRIRCSKSICVNILF